MARHDLPTNRKKELKKTFQKCFPTRGPIGAHTVQIDFVNQQCWICLIMFLIIIYNHDDSGTISKILFQ